MTTAHLTLTGQVHGTGTLTTRTLDATRITLTGQVHGTGTLTAGTSAVAGAFADFAVVPYIAAQPYDDPALTHVSAFVPRTAADPVDQWQRISITATAPDVLGLYGPVGSASGPLYPTPAAFARIGVVADAVPAETVEQVALVQVERTPAGQSIAYPDATGSVLTGLDQASGEGQVVYLADRVGAIVRRSWEMSVTGTYSLKYQWALPPSGNTYSRVTYFQEYATLPQLRSTYADVKTRAYTRGEVPAPGEPSGTGTTVGGPTSFAFTPTGNALDAVVAGVAYQCSLWAAGEIPGLTAQCQLLVYDADYALIQTVTGATSGAVGVTATLATPRKWYRARLSTPPLAAGAAWAALVPVVSSGSTPYDELAFWCDQLRVWSLSTTAPAAPGVSPARPWQSPRRFTVEVFANRVNLFQNPRLRHGTSLTATGAVTGMAAYSPPGHSTFGVDAAAGGGFDGGVAARIAVPEGPLAAFVAAGSQGYMGVTSLAGTGALIQGIRPDGAFVVSVHTQQSAGSLPSTIWAYDGSRWIRGSTTPRRQSGASAPPHRLSVVVPTGADFPGSSVIRVGYAAEDVAETYSAQPPGTTSVFWRASALTPTGAWDPTVHYTGSAVPGASAVVTHQGAVWEAVYSNGPRTNTHAHTLDLSGVLAENGSQVGTYFDGSTNSLDYIWEDPSQPYQSRSHYYRGKAVNQYRLERAVADSLPVGASYQILYAPRP
ncbi:hypothetical protein ACFVGM_08825 [Kitasatospora purpeofusca]|uniref:hypothetical protein n=1 Tax=Kitasatospora purpeofusca TaxID=67352 RepID=UPI0036C15DB8